MTTILFFLGLVLLSMTFLVPLLSFFRPKKGLSRVLLFSSLAGLLSIMAFSLLLLFSRDKFLLDLYSILPGISMSFFADRLAAFFMLIISTVSVGVIIYSFDYVKHIPADSKRNSLIAIMNFFILSMLLVVASGNFFTFLIFWELMSVSSFFLVISEQNAQESKKAGLFYFAMTQLSTAFLLMGFLILSSSGQSFFANGHLTNSPTVNLVFILLFIGFGIKAGVMPFHKWLPYAHSASPSNVSALMSGVMIKVAIYGMVRFLLSIANVELWWGILILLFGSISAVLGVIYALKEHDLKRLLAYHSIENIGIILIGIGLFVIFSHYGLTGLATLSLVGGLFHTLNHALFKSLLFMTAGSVIYTAKTRNIEKMGGLIKKMPFTAALFLTGAISISALPPFNGFVSELMIFTALFNASLIQDPFIQIILFIALSLLALTSALAAVCFVKAFGITFLAMPRSKEAEDAKEVPVSMIIGPFMIAFLCMALGIFSYQIFLSQGFLFPIPDMTIIGLSIAFFTIIVFLASRIFRSGKKRFSETWGCGIISQNPNMEYTASGFSEPIVTIFKPIYRTERICEKEYYDSKNVNLSHGFAEIKLFRFFEEYIYLPIAKFVLNLSENIGNAQSRIDLSKYLFYIFLTCILILLITGWFA